eukprot:g17811.t1
MEATGGGRSLSPAARELLRTLGSCSKHASYLRQNLRETKKYFRELRHTHGGSPGSQEGEQGLGEGEAGPAEADSQPTLLEGEPGLGEGDS